MDPLSFLKSIWKAEEPIVTDILKLRPGQVITGKIIRFYPNQMAEIQIGSHKLMAKVEATLSANQQYWFQVQSGEGKLRLKLLKDKPIELRSPDSNDIHENSIDSNKSLDGSIEQMIDQIPLQIGPHTTDLTIQWNGKKKDNGEIDSNNCRILFYLELKNIGGIFVDLQIQNRKLSIVMINEKIDQNIISEQQIIILKENLERLSFQLTSMKFEQPTGEKPLKSLLKKSQTQVSIDKRSPGVDLRI